MTEPITTNISLIVPNTGDLSGAWGTSALNPNFQTIDAKFGGVTTISLSGATTILLTVPATTGIWPGGLSQSVNSLIRFTGAQTGSATIQFTLPGFYIVENQCTGTTSVRLQPANLTGNCIGAIPGKKHQVFYDGIHMDYVDMPDPGTAYDLHTNTNAYPPWMLACTVTPYLQKDGTVYSASSYPALAQLLGSTYGGNGVTTFGVPDERNRFRLPVDGSGQGRVTSAGSGINGATLGATGGSQNHTLTVGEIPNGLVGNNSLTFNVTGTVTSRTLFGGNGGGSLVAGGSIDGPQVGSGAAYATGAPTTAAVGSGTVSIQITNSGSQAHAQMPPTSVSFITFIKT